MVCIVHDRDLDGHCCGAILKYKYPDAKIVGYDYGQPIPWDEVHDGEPVIMADVSLPMPDMHTLWLKSGRNLVWVDHHISAIKAHEQWVIDNGKFLTPVLNASISACEGAWMYLFPREAVPEAVELLGTYDSWRNKDKDYWNYRVMPFQWGMRMECTSPETLDTELFRPGNKEVDAIIKQGEMILRYQKQQYERTAKFAFETVFEGLRCICINAGGGNSTMFESVWDEEKYDAMVPMFYSGRGWTFSMYTTKDIDLSVIAKKHGGGGHAKACGFQKAELPEEFRLPPKD